MLLSSKNYILLKTRFSWVKRIVICLVLSPILVSVIYGAIIFAIWILLEIENLAGGTGSLLPYSTSGFLAVVIWCLWDRREKKSAYLRYLQSQSDEDLSSITTSHVHSLSDKKMAGKILQTRRVELFLDKDASCE